MKSKRPNEKVELGSVMHFLDYYKIKYLPDDLKQGEQNDSVDIYYDKLNLKFQVTTEDGSLVKLIRDKNVSSGTNAKDALNKFIISPIQRKINKYQGVSTDEMGLARTVLASGVLASGHKKINT